MRRSRPHCGACPRRKQFPSPAPHSKVWPALPITEMAGKKSPWGWVPTLYLAEGLPYALALAVSVVFYKNLGVSNADISFYTSLLYLPWVLKPLWSPAVDILKTRRLWIWVMQLFGGGALAAVALA